jgi:hypothetical protein
MLKMPTRLNFLKNDDWLATDTAVLRLSPVTIFTLMLACTSYSTVEADSSFK